MRKREVSESKKEINNKITNNQTVSYDSKLKRVRRREPVLSRLQKRTPKI